MNIFLKDKFGALMFYVVIRLIISEINILRVKAGLNERTEAQALTAIQNDYNELEESFYNE